MDIELTKSIRLLENNLLLNDSFRKEELIKQTAQQIIKDFGEFGMEIKFSGNPDNAYDELIDQLIFHIDNLLKSDFHHFFNFLYRIDLNETMIYKAEDLFPERNRSDIISHLIIQRELKKVLIRNYFKETGKI